MSKGGRESSTEKDYAELGYEVPNTGSTKKVPNWVKLVQLDGPLEDSLVNNLVYKPALRFHGLGGGLWGQRLSDAPSVMSESKPPSYRTVEALKARESCSTCDQGSTYNTTTSVTAVSPLSLRRRNTVAVVLVAIALLAAVAAITGLILHFLHPKAMLRANVRFTIANKNFTDEMMDPSSVDFNKIARPLCKEMDVYFLTSELADFYLGCNVVTLREDSSKSGVGVHHTLDFIENKVTNNGDRIREIIMRKSGRLKTDDTLYLLVDDLHIYLRSLRIDLERMPFPEGHPSRSKPRIPWNDDFIPSKSENTNNLNSNTSARDDILTSVPQLTHSVLFELNRTVSTVNLSPRKVLANNFVVPVKVQRNASFLEEILGHKHPDGVREVQSISNIYSTTNLEKAHNVSSNFVVRVSTVYGEGSHFTVTKASVDTMSSVANMFTDAREFNVEKERTRSKINPTNDHNGGSASDKRTSEGTGFESRSKVDNHMNNRVKKLEIPLETSYTGPAEVSNFRQTPTLDNHFTTQATNKEDNSSNSPKVFVIGTDAFLISGTVTTSPLSHDTMASLSFNMAPHIVPTTSSVMGNAESDVINTVTQNFMLKPTPVLDRPSLVALNKYMSIPKLIAKTVAPMDVQYSKAPSLKEYPSNGQFSNANPVVKVTLSDNANSHVEPNITMPRGSKPELKEIVDVPVKETPIDGDDVKWINIFSAPREKVNVSVGEIASVNDIHVPKFVLQPVQIDGLPLDSNNVIDLTIKSGTHSPAPDGFAVAQPGHNETETGSGANTDLADNHMQNVMNFLDKIMGDAFVSTSPLTNRNEPPGGSLPSNMNDLKSGLESRNDRLNSGYYQENATPSSTLLQEVQQMTRRLLRESQQNVADLMRSRPRENGIVHIGKQHKAFVSQATPFLQKTNQRGKLENNKRGFNFRAGTFQGRPAFIIARAVQSNQQPWTFLRKIGENDRRASPFDLTRRTSFSGRQFSRGHTSRTVLLQNGSKGWGMNRVERWGNPFPKRRVSTRVFQFERPSSQTASPAAVNRRALVSRMQPRASRELPTYGGFEDVVKMKYILSDLVTNMINMTDKVDRLQETIDFINKTFHETHEPMFKLEETLSNMTTSLGNLRENLNTLNDTLRSFKEFLKHFDDTLFNVDDVVTHIDGALNKLGEAVKYIELSVMDLNGTASGVVGNLVDINTALEYVNKSVFDVSYTSAYSNETLDSMRGTLDSLENAVYILNRKVNDVISGSEVINISLKDINSTVFNTHEKLSTLHAKLKDFNENMGSVSASLEKLNVTYTKMNETLEKMNEPHIFVNGTVLEVINQLSKMGYKLAELNRSSSSLTGNMTDMNKTLIDSMNWINDMSKVLNDFHINIENDTNGITVSLKTKDVIETIGMLIKMNGTLTEIGNEVDVVNVDLDRMERRIDELGRSLSDFFKILSNIETAFALVNETITVVNTTVSDTDNSLDIIGNNMETVDISFANMEVSFGNINETLNVVNTTLNAVNHTYMDIKEKTEMLNNTFEELIHSTKDEDRRAKGLESILSEFVGPTTTLNNKLYNANESLRILKSKREIIEESYKILFETLVNTQSVVNEHISKLNETELTIRKVNSSFDSVNKTFSAMEVSHENTSEKLLQLVKSYESMNLSLTNVGSAFPNMMSSVTETKITMDVLMEKIKISKDNLTDGGKIRDELVSTYFQMYRRMNELKDKVTDKSAFIGNMLNMSEDALLEIEKLKRSVNNTVLKYNELKRNVQYINITHMVLHQMFQTLNDTRKSTDEDIDRVIESTINMKEKLYQTKSLQGKYPNIVTPLDEQLTILLEKNKLFENAVTEFKSWTDKFADIDGHLWNHLGYPIRMYDDYDDLVNATNYVNKTLLKYSEVINNVVEHIQAMNAFATDSKILLNQTKTLQMQADTLSDYDDFINSKLRLLDDSLQDSYTSVESLEASLREKLKQVEALRDRFGTVNNTVGNKTYDDVINQITSELKKLSSIADVIKEGERSFKATLRHHTEVTKSYKDSSFPTGQDSEEALKKILQELENTNLNLSDYQFTLNKTQTDIQDANETEHRLTNLLENLTGDLNYRKAKHDYVVSEKMNLGKEIDLTLSNASVSLSDQNSLLRRIQKLRDRAQQIRVESKAPPIRNVQLDIEKEISATDVLERELTAANKGSKEIKMKLAKSYAKLQEYDVSSRSLQEVKEEYMRYSNTVKSLKQSMFLYEKSAEGMDKQVTAIEGTYGFLLSILDFARQTFRNVTTTNTTISEIENDLTNASKTLEETTVRLYELNDRFEAMKQNYINFTETDIDLSNSYANDALRESLGLIQNISAEFSVLNSSAIDAFFLFDETGSHLNNQILDRRNIDHVLGEEVVPRLSQISDIVEYVKPKLTFMISKLYNLHFSVDGINDTIHSTSRQLFDDKQKKLLADKHFQDMLDKQRTINQSLDSARDVLQSFTARFQDAQSLLNTLKKRLNQHPVANISLDVISENVANYNHSLAALEEHLQRSRRELQQAHDNLWIDGAAYSDNETVSDVRARFMSVHEIFNNLSSNLNFFEENLSTIEKGTNDTVSEMENIHSSLYAMEKADKQADKLTDRFLELRKRFAGTNKIFDDIIFNMSAVEATANSLKHSFSHINKAVFFEKVNPLNDILSDSNQKLLELTSNMDTLNKNIKKVDIFISEYSQLRDTTFHNEDNLEDVVAKRLALLANITDTVDTIYSDLQTNGNYSEILVSYISGLEKEIEIIKNSFRMQEKKDYVKENLDRLEIEISSLIDLKNATEKELTQAVARVTTLERLFNETIKIVEMEANMNLSLLSLSIKHQDHKDILNKSHRDFNDATDTLYNLHNITKRQDDEYFIINGTLDDMKMSFEHLNKSVEYLTNVYKDINGMLSNVRTDEQSTELLDLQKAIERYKDLKSHSKETENKLFLLEKTISDTNVLLKEVRSKLHKNSFRLINLTSEYTGVTNSQIKNLSSELKLLLEGTVGLRIPLTETLVNKTLLEKYGLVKHRFGDIRLILDQIYSNRAELQTNLDQVEEHLTNVTLETVTMDQDDKLFRADADKNMAILKQSDHKLDELEDMLKKQKKQDILSKNLPRLRKSRNNLDLNAREFIRDVKAENHSLENIESFRQMLDIKLSKLMHILISTQVELDTVERSKDQVQGFGRNASMLSVTLENLEILNLNKSTLITDKNISVGYVKKLVEMANATLLSANSSLNELFESLNDLKSKLTTTQENLVHLNETLATYSMVSEKLKEMNESLISVNKTKHIAEVELNLTKTKLDHLNDTFVKMIDEYSEFSYNSFKTDTLLKETGENITALYILLNESVVIFASANAKLANISRNLVAERKNRNELQKALAEIQLNIQTTNQQISEVNDTILKIVDNIPSLNIKFDNISADLMKDNSTLNLERNKTAYKKRTLPLLEDKYQSVDLTFELTNETLQKVEDEIERLTTIVDLLHNRIDSFRTINISTSDISKNVTHLENRLAIMKDNYQNVQEILDVLRADLDGHSVIGKNISLADVYKKYAIFNESLDIAEDVLSKIETESFEMANYFDVLNDTVVIINAALDRFEAKEKKTSKMSKDIDALGNRITDSSEELSKMADIIHELDASFAEMQQKYKDVFNKTSGNSTLIQDLLFGTRQNVTEFHNIVNGLKREFDESSRTFARMINTLFKDVGKYTDLTDALTEVRDIYDDVSSTLNRLEKAVVNAQVNTTGINPSIEKLSSLLKNLDSNLHLEQLKYDFLQDNFGGLNDKLDGLNVPARETDLSIQKSSKQINETYLTLRNLSSLMNDFTNVHIPLKENFASVDEMTVGIRKLGKKVNGIMTSLGNLHENVSSLIGTMENVTEIQSRYMLINMSLDGMMEDILGVNKLLAEIDRNSSAISSEAIEVRTSLQTLDSLNKNVFSLRQSLESLQTEANNQNKSLSGHTVSAQNLMDSLEEMNMVYLDVNDTELQNNLTDLQKRVQSSILRLQKLQSLQSKLSEDALFTNNSLLTTLGHMEQDILSKAKLDDVILQTNLSLQDITNQSALLQYTNNNLQKEIHTLAREIVGLEKEMDILNQSFTAEKAKQVFISDTFPIYKKSLSDIEKLLNFSNVNLAGIKVDINETESQFTALMNRMEGIDEINIPLDEEFKQLQQMKNDIKTALAVYRNVSEMYNDTNIGLLRNKSLSLSDLKSLYKMFGERLKNIRNALHQLNGKSEGITDVNAFLNDSLNDLNDTIDNFVKIYDELEATKHITKMFTSNMTKTDGTMSKLSNDLQDLENMFNGIVDSFSYLTGNNISPLKDKLDKMIGDSKTKLTALQNAFSLLKQDSNKKESEVAKITATLLSTKTLLDQLKEHVAHVNASSQKLQKNIDHLNFQHNDFNASLTSLPPELHTLLQKISELNDTYVKENNKLLYINQHRPSLDVRFRDLQGVLEQTNKRLSLTDVQLADLKYSINIQGEELDNFPTLNITTNKERELWQGLQDRTDELSRLFRSVSSEYSDTQANITTLTDRSSNLSEIINKYQKLNKTLEKIERKTEDINGDIDDIVITTNITLAVLDGFKETVENLRSLQNLADETRLNLEKSSNTSSYVNRDIQSAIQNTELLLNVLNSMEVMYSPLSTGDIESKFAILREEITLQRKNLENIKLAHDKLASKLNDISVSFTSIFKQLNYSVLSRFDADAAIANMSAELRWVKSDVAKLEPALTDVSKHSSKESEYLNDLNVSVTNFNKTLHGELLKFNFVKAHLPPTQRKYVEINATFNANLPDVQKMKEQIKILTDIIDTIKTKMDLLGMTDGPKEVTNWTKTVATLNSTVNRVLEDNKRSAVTLENLYSALWRNRTMYGKNETLDELRQRFNGYNKTLDGINSSAVVINLKMKDLSTEAKNMTVLLMERDSILTTTPATTTPSGPPEWLTFTSSGTGTVGKDSGFLKCSVGNTQDWKLMKITRLEKDGRETAVAAWMVGRGARKAMRDRRISVRKTEEATGVSSLHVQIKSLQCEDEGTYLCSIDSYDMWPLEAQISITTPPEDNLRPEFPTEVFEDKVANFSCSGHPGYPNGAMSWHVKHENEAEFKPFTFYSARPKVTDNNCVRTETNKVEYQFDMSWNNTRIRCYIDNTDYYAEGVIRLLPYDICNRVRYLGTIGHPYTPHKYIVCGKELNIMECPGNTCYDKAEENCVQCKATQGNSDPCHGQPLFSYVPHESDCRKYYICMGPTKTPKKCAKGYFQPNIPGNCVISYAQSHCAKNKNSG